MRDVQRLTADEFFAWQALVEGRYELVDGHIVPHPDYVTPAGFAAPDAEHGLVCLNLGIALQAQLRAPCRAYVGVCVVVDRADANISDVAVSCDQDDRSRPALIAPRYVFEVSSQRRIASTPEGGRRILGDPDHRGVCRPRPAATFTHRLSRGRRPANVLHRHGPPRRRLTPRRSALRLSIGGIADTGRLRRTHRKRRA